MFFGGAKLKVIKIMRHMILAKGHSKNKCWIDSSLSQKAHFLQPCHLRLARLSFVKITL
jgi:hypothetical protein